MPWRVRFHPLVRRDLTAIAALLADAAGQDAAARRLAEIEAAARSLADDPLRGTRRDEIAPGLRALPASRRGVIAFTVDETARQVRVVALPWGGADWMGRVQTRR
jgi:plasmid stabilization system protein ParE